VLSVGNQRNPEGGDRMSKSYKRKINKYTNLIAKEYEKKHPNKTKIARYAKIGGNYLRRWKR
jgi:hypothetical protein